ncbi:MAG: methyltransferase [Bacilli bacterium]|nr:methyltransferase [Bacilli bacterium]
MTNKILVTVLVPMIEEEYDVYIPISKKIKVTTKLLVKTISELSEGHFPLKENSVLISNNLILDNNFTVKECGIKNGDKIVLI